MNYYCVSFVGAKAPTHIAVFDEKGKLLRERSRDDPILAAAPNAVMRVWQTYKHPVKKIPHALSWSDGWAVSAEMLAAMQSLRIAEHTQRTLKVENDSAVVLGERIVMLPRHEFHVLDGEGGKRISCIELDHGNYKRLFVNDYRIPDLDFFYATNGFWIATERFVEWFKRHRFTGMTFSYLFSYEEIDGIPYSEVLSARGEGMKRRDWEQRVEAWGDFVRANWAFFRRFAQAFYASGTERFTLIVPLEQGPGPDWLDAKRWQYIDSDTVSQNRHDADLKALAKTSKLGEYNREREISFLFNEEQSSVSRGAVFAEYPDGTPVPSKKERDRRWAGHERRCPQCAHTFLALGDVSVCPQCNHPFLASDVDYASQGRPAIPPMTAPM